MDADDRTLLTASLDRVVGETPPERLPRELDEFGWRDLLDDEPDVAVSVLFELLGKHRTAGASLDTVTVAAAGADPRTVALVYPALSSPAPTSTVDVAASGVTLAIRGVAAARPECPEVVLVPALLDGTPVIAQVTWRDSWPASGTGVDPEGAWTTVTAETGDVVLFTGGRGIHRWRSLRAAAHRALAHELYGAASAMLDLAVSHVETRTQFGRPLGSFQAVKHRLADVRLWQEAAGLATAAAWEPKDSADAETAAVLAKLVATRFSRLAREHCQQVLGGMGFTWEHDFHRYVRHVLVPEQLLGSTERLHALLGEHLHVTATQPRLATL